MDEQGFLDVISGRRSGAIGAVLRGGLSLATPGYRGSMALRNWLYDAGLKPTHTAGVPVISVGNLTTGGTGKTPMVAWLAEWFRSRGRQPCLVSRGYRPLDEAGNDERRVLEQLCPDVPHVQDRDRVAASRRAVSEHSPDVIILDDGFQHRRLRRDLDIVLIDALNPWGYERLLPRGLLREPKSSLRRAGVVVITRADQIDEGARSELRTEIGRVTEVPIAEVAFRPQRLIDQLGNSGELSLLAGESLVGCCGIGNPEGFRRTLAAAGFEDVPVTAFADHHHYTAGDWRGMEAAARTSEARAIVTTQKDLVKLDPDWLTLPVWAVVIGAEFLDGQPNLEERLMPFTKPDRP